MTTFIDPPSGWMYGFPKVLPEGVPDIKVWLLANGYPQHEIDSCGSSFHCRFWEQHVTT